MKMPFGKYKGEELSDIPAVYLEWLLENVSMKDDLHKAVEEAWIAAEEKERDPFSDWREEVDSEYAQQMGLDPEWYKDET